jgi:hypothetical protein
VIAVLTVDFDQAVKPDCYRAIPSPPGNEVCVENSLEVAYVAELKFPVKPLFA